MPPKQNKKKSPVRVNDTSAQSVGGDSSYDLHTLLRIVDQLQQSILEIKQMISDKSSDNSENQGEDHVPQQSSKHHHEGKHG